MRAVWSFWSKPYRELKGRAWREPLHHLLAWGLSVRLAERHFPETMLVTDEYGKQLLVDQLRLPFGRVSTELENYRNADTGWWALGKLAAYHIQDRPFVHLDTDVFLWKPLPNRLLSAPVFTQCPEIHAVADHGGPKRVETVFQEHGLSLPAEWTETRKPGEGTFREENCGIMGAAHPEFIRHYSNLALDFLLNPLHQTALNSLGRKDGYNQIVEQFLLSACLTYHRQRMNSPFSGVRVAHLFETWDQCLDPSISARLGFTHLLGDAKRHSEVSRRLEQRVQREDRSYFQRCVRVAAQNLV